MKQIFIIISCVLLCFNTSAQYMLVTNVKTPNNSTVASTYVYTGTDFSITSGQLAAYVTDLAVNYNGAELVDLPSQKYNCHGYAWHVSEGGDKVWIGLYSSTAEDIYWTDGSYMEVPESIATKVSYCEEANHSAIRLNSNWYISKWGNNGLVKHHPENLPYYPVLPRKYYIRTPKISGSSGIISSLNAIFTVSNPPSGYTWTCSSNLTAGVASGNSKTFTVKSNNTSCNAWVAIKVG